MSCFHVKGSFFTISPHVRQVACANTVMAYPGAVANVGQRRAHCSADSGECPAAIRRTSQHAGSMNAAPRVSMSAKEAPPFMTVKAAADKLVVSRWMIYRLIWDGKVESVLVGRCRRIVRSSFEAYMRGLLEEAAR